MDPNASTTAGQSISIATSYYAPSESPYPLPPTFGQPPKTTQSSSSTSSNNQSQQAQRPPTTSIPNTANVNVPQTPIIGQQYLSHPQHQPFRAGHADQVNVLTSTPRQTNIGFVNQANLSQAPTPRRTHLVRRQSSRRSQSKPDSNK
ncbi:hypothetical protein HDU76_002632, partial [Blyttiomyces sp. JEL0837]